MADDTSTTPTNAADTVIDNAEEEDSVRGAQDRKFVYADAVIGLDMTGNPAHEAES